MVFMVQLTGGEQKKGRKFVMLRDDQTYLISSAISQDPLNVCAYRERYGASKGRQF
jgi:hypothetical protein